MFSFVGEVARLGIDTEVFEDVVRGLSIIVADVHPLGYGATESHHHKPVDKRALNLPAPTQLNPAVSIDILAGQHLARPSKRPSITFLGNTVYTTCSTTVGHLVVPLISGDSFPAFLFIIL